MGVLEAARGQAIFVTGAAGFIGFHTAQSLLKAGHRVVGFDNLNPYYDPTLKKGRLNLLKTSDRFEFIEGSLENRDLLDAFFQKERPPVVIHLAAQAGVRHSLTHPHDYVNSNLVGFMNILEGCRHAKTRHLVYASSSSVYGMNTSLPFKESEIADHPLSLYAATKRANELMAHSYSHLYKLPTTGLRFFTVYGPWGRPDMALFSFTKAILEDRPVPVFNHGNMLRDFTYVDDIVTGVLRCADTLPSAHPAWDSKRPRPDISSAPYRVYNIGNNTPEKLTTVIQLLEKALGRKANVDLQDIQPGDVPATYASIDELQQAVNFHPHTPLSVGVERFVAWYIDYYGHSTLNG